MSTSNRVAIIGVGNVGKALGARLAEVGYEVVFGLNKGGDGNEAIAATGGTATALPAREAVVDVGMVFLAVPGSVAVEVAAGLGDLGDAVLVDCTNPIRWDEGPVWNPPAEGSVTAAIAARGNAERIVKAFNTFGAEFHRDPTLGGGNVDVYLAGGSAEARGAVGALVEKAGFAAVDAGPMRNAAVLENLAVLWIHLALVGGKGRDVAFKLVSR